MIRLADIRAALRRHGRVIVVLVTRAHGSTPRDAGAAMLVTDTGAFGTIGGGAVEHEALNRARAALQDPTAEGAIMDTALGPDLDQCCGGRMQVAIAPLDRPVPLDGDALMLWPGGPVMRDAPPDRPVVVYGAGHVGQALIHALAPLPLNLTWVDTRPGLMGAAPPGVRVVESPLPEHVATTAPDDAMHVVLTHSHALDLEIVAAILPRPHAFCGLIGSDTKRALFRRRLKERGIAADRLTCPIGLPGPRDKRPAVIAAGIAAQLIAADQAAEPPMSLTG